MPNPNELVIVRYKFMNTGVTLSEQVISKTENMYERTKIPAITTLKENVSIFLLQLKRETISSVAIVAADNCPNNEIIIFFKLFFDVNIFNSS